MFRTIVRSRCTQVRFLIKLGTCSDLLQFFIAGANQLAMLLVGKTEMQHTFRNRTIPEVETLSQDRPPDLMTQPPPIVSRIITRNWMKRG